MSKNDLVLSHSATPSARRPATSTKVPLIRNGSSALMHPQQLQLHLNHLHLDHLLQLPRKNVAQAVKSVSQVNDGNVVPTNLTEYSVKILLCSSSNNINLHQCHSRSTATISGHNRILSHRQITVWTWNQRKPVSPPSTKEDRHNLYARCLSSVYILCVDDASNSTACSLGVFTYHIVPNIPPGASFKLKRDNYL